MKNLSIRHQLHQFWYHYQKTEQHEYRSETIIDINRNNIDNHWQTLSKKILSSLSTVPTVVKHSPLIGTKLSLSFPINKRLITFLKPTTTPLQSTPTTSILLATTTTTITTTRIAGTVSTTSSITTAAATTTATSAAINSQEEVFEQLSNDLMMQLLSVEQRSTTGNDTGEVNQGDGTNVLTSNTFFLLFISVTLVCLISLTILGNLFVIYAIMLERNLKTVGNYLVFSLAVTDLFVACLVMPIGAIYEVTQEWKMGIRLCEIWTFFDVLCCTASIFHLLAIAADRYWAVTTVDYIHRRKAKHICAGIAFIWLLSGTVSLGPIFGWKDEHFERRIIEHGVCIVSQSASYQIFATIISFYAPSILILLLYYRIYQVAKTRIKLKKQRKYRVRRKPSFYRPTVNRKESVKELPSTTLSIHRSSFNPSSSDYFGLHSSSSFYSSSTTTTTTDNATTATNVTLVSNDGEKISPNSLSPLAIVMPDSMAFSSMVGTGNNELSVEKQSEVKRLSIHHFLAFQQQKQGDMCEKYVRRATQSTGIKETVEEEDTTTSSSSNAAVITVAVPSPPLRQPLPASSSNVVACGDEFPSATSSSVGGNVAPTVETAEATALQHYNQSLVAFQNSTQHESLDLTEGDEELKDEEEDEEMEEEMEEEDEEADEEDEEADEEDEEEDAAENVPNHTIGSPTIEIEKESASPTRPPKNDMKLKVISSLVETATATTFNANGLKVIDLEPANGKAQQPQRPQQQQLQQQQQKNPRKLSVKVVFTGDNSFPRKSSIARKSSLRNGNNNNCNPNSCGRSLTPNSGDDEEEVINGQQQSRHNSIKCCVKKTCPTVVVKSNSGKIKKLKFRNKITRYGSSSHETKQESKAAKTLTIITGIFIICWLPFFVLALVMPLCTECIINKYFFDFCLWLGWTNSSVNPFLYTIFSPDFRNAFKRLIWGQKRHRKHQQKKNRFK